MDPKQGGLLRGMAVALAGAMSAGAQAMRDFKGAMVIDESTPLKRLTRRRRTTRGYIDKVGMPHAHSGDKMIRKAMTGQVGMTKPKGWLHTWSSTKVASMGLGERRRPRTPNIVMPKPVSHRQARKSRKAEKARIMAAMTRIDDTTINAMP